MQGLSYLISPGEWFLSTLIKTATAPLRREFRCEFADTENTHILLNTSSYTSPFRCKVAMKSCERRVACVTKSAIIES
jgi:hypothetical protein